MATKTSNAGTEVGRPQPQTTTETGPGPFIRFSQPGRLPQYVSSQTSFGGLISNPLLARPGYYSRFRLKFKAQTGVKPATGKKVGVKADAPFSCVAQLVFKDAFGTPIFVGPGWTILFAVPLLSGGFGAMKYATVKNLPSYTAIATGATKTGNFIFSSCLPLEFSKGIGVIAGANASLPPQLTVNLNASTAVYKTSGTTKLPATLPKLTLQVDSDIYWLPEGATVEPPGLGTTRQWLVQAANPTVSSTSSLRIQFPRLGGFLTVICIIARNTAGTRVDIWPGYKTTSVLTTGTKRIRILIDGIPIWDTTIAEALDDFAITWPTVTRPTGLLAFSRRTAMNQMVLGLLTSGEQYLSTNPGTLIEITGSPWGKFSSGPATVSVLLGQIVPAGTLIQGLPEV